jgi:acyl-[acyl carrier protein]--UDP-N-acetylglucosamine O-acyltransferase
MSYAGINSVGLRRRGLPMRKIFLKFKKSTERFSK